MEQTVVRSPADCPVNGPCNTPGPDALTGKSIRWHVLLLTLSLAASGCLGESNITRVDQDRDEANPPPADAGSTQTGEGAMGPGTDAAVQAPEPTDSQDGQAPAPPDSPGDQLDASDQPMPPDDTPDAGAADSAMPPADAGEADASTDDGGDPTPAAPCGDVASGTSESRVRYELSEAPEFGQCRAEQQVRTCLLGEWGPWSGTFTFEQCSVPAEASNVALGKPTAQSQFLAPGFEAGNAVDGLFGGPIADNPWTAAAPGTSPDGAWWVVYLGARFAISSVVVHNISHETYFRLADYHVEICTDDAGICRKEEDWVGKRYEGVHPEGAPDHIDFDGVIGTQVRIRLEGTEHLALDEVQVLGVLADRPTTNVALNMPATQSSLLGQGFEARNAVDGMVTGDFGNSPWTATNVDLTGEGSWWMVDLGRKFAVSSVTVHNIDDPAFGDLQDYHVELYDQLGDRWVEATYPGVHPRNAAQTFRFNGELASRVRVRLPGTNSLRLREVEVLATSLAPSGDNLALGRPATTSSLWEDHHASRAVDGKFGGPFSETPWATTDTHPDGSSWWMVDLEGEYAIDTITVHNPNDSSYHRLMDYHVEVINGGGGWVEVFHRGVHPRGFDLTFELNGIVGSRVRVRLDSGTYLSLDEVEVRGAPLGATP